MRSRCIAFILLSSLLTTACGPSLFADPFGIPLSNSDQKEPPLGTQNPIEKKNKDKETPKENYYKIVIQAQGDSPVDQVELATKLPLTNKLEGSRDPLTWTDMTSQVTLSRINNIVCIDPFRVLSSIDAKTFAPNALFAVRLKSGGRYLLNRQDSSSTQTTMSLGYGEGTCDEILAKLSQHVSSVLSTIQYRTPGDASADMTPANPVLYFERVNIHVNPTLYVPGLFFLGRDAFKVPKKP